MKIRTALNKSKFDVISIFGITPQLWNTAAKV